MNERQNSHYHKRYHQKKAKQEDGELAVAGDNGDLGESLKNMSGIYDNEHNKNRQRKTGMIHQD